MVASQVPAASVNFQERTCPGRLSTCCLWPTRASHHCGLGGARAALPAGVTLVRSVKREATQMQLHAERGPEGVVSLL